MVLGPLPHGGATRLCAGAVMPGGVRAWDTPARSRCHSSLPPSTGSALALQEQHLPEEVSRARAWRGLDGGARGSVLPPEVPPMGVHPAFFPGPPALDPPQITQHPVSLPRGESGGQNQCREGATPPETSHLSRDGGVSTPPCLASLSTLGKCAEGAVG